MAYIPTEWETGDVITAEKLNNIENGIVVNEEAIDDATEHGVYMLAGDGTLDYATQQTTFVITSGDIDDVVSNPDRFYILKVKYYASVGGTTNLMGTFYLPLSMTIPENVGSEEVTTLVFSNVVYINNAVYYFRIIYDVLGESWTALSTKVD